MFFLQKGVLLVPQLLQTLFWEASAHFLERLCLPVPSPAASPAFLPPLSIFLFFAWGPLWA